MARQNVATQVNNELLNTYWNIGRIICEHEQSDPERADYGKQTLKELAKVLTEMKTIKLTTEAAGQVNMYLNYYANEANNPDDNPPILK